MLSKTLRNLSPLLGLSLVMASGCVKSVCESDNDCPTGAKCLNGACRKKACSVDVDCPAGKFCDKATSLCSPGCRDSSECPEGNACAQNKCWPVTNPIPVDGGQDDDAGGQDDGGALLCSCLQAPRACLVDINPVSSSAGTSVCEPGNPPRATLMFFGNVGCSHCQSIFSQLLEIESQLRSEGLNPTLTFVQLKDWEYTGAEVTSTFPSHRGPVLQDTVPDDMWEAYGADWYELKIIDGHGCLSAFFTPPDTFSLVSGGSLQTTGSLVKEAWRSAMSDECHSLIDAGQAPGSGL